MPNFQRAILTHGGAGSDPKDFDGPKSAANRGMDLMANGETALTAVVDAVTHLEDDPRFNAGSGSKLRIDGHTVQLDASCMTRNNEFGAVAFDGTTFAAALSSGGLEKSALGRVGDVPLPGWGLYCGASGAVACTGDGELIVLKRVVQEIRKTDYKVGVITTASETPEQRGKDYHRVFTTLGASRIDIFNIKERVEANDRKSVKTIADLDLIFFTGGDQLRLTTILGGTRIFDAIQERLKNGALIAGTSAGATVFSDTMIYEGKSEDGLFKGSVLSTSGFGFVNKIIIDTHFMARGRIGRLIQIVASNPTCIGVGIGEDSELERTRLKNQK